MVLRIADLHYQVLAQLFGRLVFMVVCLCACVTFFCRMSDTEIARMFTFKII